MDIERIKMLRFIYALLITVFLAGCVPAAVIEPSETTEPTKAILPSPENTWTTIKMIHSGGIMGLSRSIEISSDGTYKVIELRALLTNEGKLSSSELKELKQLISSLEYVPNDKPYGCADCFIYDIEITRGTGKPFSARVDDVTLEDSGLSPLVTALRKIIDRELN
jgi:hypothetical protein